MVVLVVTLTDVDLRTGAQGTTPGVTAAMEEEAGSIDSGMICLPHDLSQRRRRLPLNLGVVQVDSLRAI